MISLRLVLLALLLLPLPALGASSLRPYAGRGVLTIPTADQSVDVEFYEYPSVRWKGSMPLTDFPALSPALSPEVSEIVIAATALREGSARVAVAPSGEEGWIILRPDWRYLPWERFLVKRTVRLMTDLPETASRIHQIPAKTGETVDSTATGSPLPVEEIRGDWALIMKEGNPLGWLRWRDGDGRLLVTVE